MTRRKIVQFTWEEWKWMVVIIMLGVTMYWTAIVVEPTYQLLKEAEEVQQVLEENQEEILENQDNSTMMTLKIVNTTETTEDQARKYFLQLQLQHQNTTQDIKETQNNITELLARLHPPSS